MLFFTTFTSYKAKRHNINLNDKGMENKIIDFKVDFENVETKPVQSGIKRRFHNFNDWIDHVFNNVNR